MAACVVLGVLTLVLSFQNIELHRRIRELGSVETNPSIALREGDSVVGIDLLDVKGDRRPLVDRSTDWTLVYLFARRCETCTIAAPAWKSLAAGSNGPVRFVAVSLDQFDSAEFSAAEQLSTPVYTALDARGPLSRVRMIPAAILISSDGSISRIWTGLADRRVFADMQTSLLRISTTAASAASESDPAGATAK
jgi:hypothetical protein